MVRISKETMYDFIFCVIGLLGMVPPGTMLPNQLQPNITVAVPPKPEDTIVVCNSISLLCKFIMVIAYYSIEQCGSFRN